MDGGVDGGARGVERPLADERHRVHRVQPDLGPDRRRAPPGGVPRRVAGGREQVRHDLRLTRIVEVTLGHPGRIRARHEVDELGVVHGRDRIEPEVGRVDDRRARVAQLVVERVAALGFLVADLAHAEPVAAVRGVAAVARGPDSGHAQRHRPETSHRRRGARWLVIICAACHRRPHVSAPATSD